MLRLEHHLRSPPATSPSPSRPSAVSFPTLPRRSAVRLARRAAAPSFRAETSTSAIVRASSAPRAASASSEPSTMESEVVVAHREVARALASQAEVRLDAWLLPSAVPADAAEFRNGTGNAVGSLDVHRAAPGSTESRKGRRKGTKSSKNSS
ncbi:hypothetical protein E2562_034714 [Oryza meyeriana var. granulata]|uniref:Uncharacterized protein n=1 Tax=Oryza meyeriana var. granulata TaxID=110450 RepID=A0A6G1C9C0_9ORYZ|nr:hypothetical protein E2562_034714 [Oryza meyeriana var. granulata]